MMFAVRSPRNTSKKQQKLFIASIFNDKMNVQKKINVIWRLCYLNYGHVIAFSIFKWLSVMKAKVNVRDWRLILFFRGKSIEWRRITSDIYVKPCKKISSLIFYAYWSNNDVMMICGNVNIFVWNFQQSFKELCLYSVGMTENFCIKKFLLTENWQN